ncbi:MAG: hypothetical protein IKC64_01335, partial [Clostridia bacterium]|nr:hypothetical protein [Clostridia bacterium]
MFDIENNIPKRKSQNKSKNTSGIDLIKSLVFEIEEIGFYSQISSSADAFTPVILYSSVNGFCSVLSKFLLDDFSCKIKNGLDAYGGSDNVKLGVRCIIRVSLADIIVSLIRYLNRKR